MTLMLHFLEMHCEGAPRACDVLLITSKCICVVLLVRRSIQLSAQARRLVMYSMLVSMH